MVLKGLGFTNGIIILEEPEAVYYSGQLVSGNVHFELKETVAYSAIHVTCLGEALVVRMENQYEMSGAQNRYREVKYEGREQYLNFTQCISGGVGTISILQSGVHSMPFQFQVPFNAPSSFKQKDGNIMYSITAHLQYPEPERKEILVKEFEVVAPISPNTLAKMKRPLEFDFEEIETCNCFCASKPIKMKIVLPSAALGVGNTIPINVEVKNDSSIEIYEIIFSITKRHKYRTQHPRSEYSTPEETLMEVKKGPVLSNTRRDYCWELPMPPVLLPNLESCSIMDVTYFIKVKIRMTGCNEDVEDESEVFIGVLPQGDASAVTSPDLAVLLPKAPLPDPNSLPIGLNVPGTNYIPNSHAPQQYASRTVPNLAENSQKIPYEIGFRSTIEPSYPPYPAGNVNNGYPYPGVPPAAAGSPYLSRPPPYNLSSSQQNIAVAPSAPPL